MGKRELLVLILLLALALILAACNGDDDNGGDNEPAGDAGGFTPDAPNVNFGADLAGDNEMPGCADPNDDECPAAVEMPFDATITAEDVTVGYPAQYFDATTDALPDGVLVQITPSDNNRYVEQAIFTVYFAESVDAALAVLNDPEIAEWQTATMTGMIGVSRDATQDPPVNTTVGAFETADGRVIVLQVTTTGKYGWDLWRLVYGQMLELLVVGV